VQDLTRQVREFVDVRIANANANVNVTIEIVSGEGSIVIVRCGRLYDNVCE
jgi:hypothetical protein